MNKKTLLLLMSIILPLSLSSCVSSGGGDSEQETIKPNEILVNFKDNKSLVRWAKVEGASGYNVYACETNYGEYVLLNNKPLSENRYEEYLFKFGYFKVSYILDGKEYFINEEGESVFANTLTIMEDDDMNKVQNRIDEVHDRLETGNRGQFSSERFAMMLYPGNYPNLNAKVGYYTSLMGLGKSPLDTHIHEMYVSDNVLSNKNSTCTFWRGVENIAIDTDVMWCVSQATSFRRNYVKGNLALSSSGWSSGGFLANTVVTGTVRSGTQQQWFTRNTDMGSWNGSSYNMVFSGVSKAPRSTWSSSHFTSIEKTERMAEKPFIFVDGYDFKVSVPDYKENTVDTTWKEFDDIENSTVYDLEEFYIANPKTDDSKSLNEALENIGRVIFVPGHYVLDEPLQVNNPNSVLLGMGYVTLEISEKNKTAAIITKDVENVRIANILIDAGKSSKNMVVIGEGQKNEKLAQNPIVLSDLFFRIGGVSNVHTETDTALVVSSDYVIGDNFWIWRADHSRGIAWSDYENDEGNMVYGNPAETGILVNGDYVICYALMVEHFRKYQTHWKGEYGKVIMYQSETPYRVDSQDEWMSHDDTVNGYSSYKVDDNVKYHDGQGIGVYWVNYSEVILANAIEVPETEGVVMYHLVTTNFTSSYPGYIENVINGTGGSGQGGSARYVEVYPKP